MSALSIFSFEGARVRMLEQDGEPWFVASDVCAVLGIANHRDAVSRLDDDEKGVGTTDTLGGAQSVAIISEPGVYGLTWTSRKPEAAAFRRWLKHDVVPSIRRTGTYSAPAPTEDEIVQQALTILVRKTAALEAKVAEDAPKVEAYDQLMDADGYYSMESAAKMCGVGRNTLYRRLREAGVIQPGSTLPYQKHMHHFVLTAGSWTDREGNVHPTQTTRVRPSGLAFILRKVDEP